MSAIKPKTGPSQPPISADAYRNIKPNEMLANKNHATHDPASLVLSPFKRFPLQPDMPSYPVALQKEARLEMLEKDRSRLFLADKQFPQIWLRYAREQDQAKRIETRRRFIRDDIERREEHADDVTERQRRHFFKTVYDIVRRREHAYIAMRYLMRATFEHKRAVRIEAGRVEAEQTKQLIEDGFKRHAAFLKWRLDDLYILLGNKSVVKVSGSGQKLEHEIGRLCADLHRIASEKHHTWRSDNLFTTLPNGGIAHIHKVGGEQIEKVAAEVHAPVVRERSADFRNWHDSKSTITTPNGGWIEMSSQGRMPESTTAHLNIPKIEKRAQDALDWHREHLLQAQPNGGFMPATSQNFGTMPETVTGDVAWKHKHKVICQNWDWRLSNTMTMTGNGGIARQEAGVGKLAEHVSAEREQPHKDEVTRGFDTWHREHMFGPTPNGGYSPLKNHGHSIEAMAAKASDAPRDFAADRTDLWHEMHNFKGTPNGGWAPLRDSGASLEKVGGEITGGIKDEIVKERNDRYLADMFVPTPNHGWRRLGRSGRPFEKVVSDVAKPNEGIGAMEPITSQGGHALIESKMQVVRSHESRRDSGIKAFERALAMQAQVESHFKAHAQPPRPGESPTAPSDPVPVRPKEPPKTGHS